MRRSPSKLQDQLAYPPRGMRLDRAAAYLGIGTTTFTLLVEEKVLPQPMRIRGAVVWDRLELDASFENLKEPPDDESPRENTVHRLLGIKKNRDD